MRSPPNVSDLGRLPGELARELIQWQRGDHGEAAALTLAASAADLHSDRYTLWVWTGFDAIGNPAWAVPVGVDHAHEFSPRGPARALARCLAGLVEAGGEPDRIVARARRGFTALIADGATNDLAEPEFAQLALTEHHPDDVRIATARLPDDELLDGPPIAPDPPQHGGVGLLDPAHATGSHPIAVALTLIAHGQRPDEDSYPPELVRSLREWGLDGAPPARPTTVATGIDDDPCPRRRHARRLLRRLLRLGKVGSQRHTAFDHLHRGAPADQRAEAREVGEALLRAGLLGEKPSVGQRHVFLRREALPRIHALIDRGETDSRALATLWTAPTPNASTVEVPDAAS